MHEDNAAEFFGAAPEYIVASVHHVAQADILIAKGDLAILMMGAANRDPANSKTLMTSTLSASNAMSRSNKEPTATKGVEQRRAL